MGHDLADESNTSLSSDTSDTSDTKRIEIEGVTKYFGEKRVLDDVSLGVSQHEVVCLIGASGSGKSTILKCVNDLVPIDGGVIKLDGVSIHDPRFGKSELYKRIGIVFQSYNLFPHMNVVDNITLAPRRVHGITKRECETQAHELLSIFGLDGFADSYPEQLSGGQQQRVAIVRAMANHPDVLMLDEVTAALDPELIGDVLAVIRNLKERGLTMIIVTHEMGFAREVADRICFLDEGKILEEAPPDRLFSNPTNLRTRQFLQRIIDAGRM